MRVDWCGDEPAHPMTETRPNKLCLWRDSVLYLGDSFDPQMHRHHAVQCCIALEEPLEVRWEDGGAWHACHSAVIGANIPHSIKNPCGQLCILYLEKASSDYRSILDFRGVSAERGVRIDPLLSSTPVSRALREKLLRAMSTDLDPDAANDLRDACLQLLHGHISPATDLDPRLSALLATLHERPGESFAGDELARGVGLSQSRMQHLFKEQMGIPVRRYVLWMRLRHVLELAVAGESLTAAAHASGFSDLAHFTRTFRAMFGIKPSALLGGGAGLVPLLCERT